MKTTKPIIEVFARKGHAGCLDCTGMFGPPTLDPFGFVHVTVSHDPTCPAWRHRNAPGSALAANSRPPALIDGKPTFAVLEHVQAAFRGGADR